ncbi:MAG: thioredoxin family protein [Candidatus Coatesbacteria bacterium]
MAWIEGDVRTKVEAQLKDLAGPVKMVLFADALTCEACPEMKDLLGELAGISDKLKYEEHNRLTEPDFALSYGVTKSPALVLEGPAGARVRFFGLPVGYEFVSLLEALHEVAAGKAEVAADTRERLGNLTRSAHIQVFVTPTCPYCPAAVRTAHRLATVFPQITADMVEASEFPELAEKYGVRGVPQIVVNDTVSLVGAQREGAFVDAILRATAASV